MYLQAYCDMETDGGGWTVIQRRIDGSVDFYLGWSEYIHGFGNLSGEYWLGLSKLHRLANSNMTQQLRVDIESFGRGKYYATYGSFYIRGPATDYQLHVSGYNGTAGDAMTYSSGMKFTTKDNENDLHDYYHCGQYRYSGWWHKFCTYANLNGKYYTNRTDAADTIYWFQLWNNKESLKFTVMMIRANSD